MFKRCLRSASGASVMVDRLRVEHRAAERAGVRRDLQKI